MWDKVKDEDEDVCGKSLEGRHRKIKREGEY